MGQMLALGEAVARCVCNKFFSCYAIIPHLLRISGGRNANDRHFLHRQSAFSLRAPCHVARLSHQHPGSGAAQSNGTPHLGQSFCTLHPTTSRTIPHQAIPRGFCLDLAAKRPVMRCSLTHPRQRTGSSSPSLVMEISPRDNLAKYGVPYAVLT